LPSQAVSLIRFNIFKRLGRSSFEYWTTADEEIKISGSICKIPTLSKNRFFRYFRRLLWFRRIKPEIIIFSGEFWDLLFYFFRPRESILVLHLNGPVPRYLKDYPYRNFKFDLLWLSVVFFVRRVDYILTISEYTADSLKTFRPVAKITVIYNGVDLKQFKPEKRNKFYVGMKLNLDDSRKIFTFVGALIRRKQPQIFIELAKHFPEIQFVLVGKDDPEIDFSGKIKEAKNIFWIKEMSREDIAVLLASSDLFIFPSLFEGFGMVVAEAMASGLPVVVSPDSGPEELVRDGGGFVVSRKNNEKQEISQFAEAIKRLLADSEKIKRMKLLARQQASKKFNWDKLSLDWADFLRICHERKNKKIIER